MNRNRKAMRRRSALTPVLTLLISIIIVIVCQQLYRDSQHIAYPRRYSGFVAASSQEFNVPEQIIYATIKTESNFQKNARSSAGAVGLMQLMPETFEWLTTIKLKEDLPSHSISDPYTNIRYGTYMLSWLYDTYGNWETAFAAYNAGVGNVNSWLGDSRYSSDGVLTAIPFPETRAYVERQLENIDKYEKLYYTGE